MQVGCQGEIFNIWEWEKDQHNWSIKSCNRCMENYIGVRVWFNLQNFPNLWNVVKVHNIRTSERESVILK